MDKLADWINPAYLDRGTVDELRAVFEKEKQILLKDFLRKDAYELAMKLARAAKFKRVFIPDQMSCAFAMKPDALLAFLVSEKFALYIEMITGVKPGHKAFYTEFRAGDYAVIKDLPQDWKLVAHLTLSPWDESWGGRMIFRDAQGNHLSSCPQANALLLTQNQKKLRGYVEYVNHHAGKKTSVTANVG
ncbi:MAG TPA: hypothetical protein VLJ21_05125 [Candidatus Binatia bacterium]|nr:hypothetical protein [Candidatus Binatia bacterium]